MKRILSWLGTAIFLIAFPATFVLFHPILALTRLIGDAPFKAILDLMNLVVLLLLRLVNTRFKVEGSIPEHAGSTIIISNHQSMFDIPFIIWYLRKLSPKFVAKKELGRWIPSISFSLRNMGSVLIDRSDPASAIPQIETFGKRCAEMGWSASIFPEGTRARDGAMKKFKPSGIRALMRTMPQAPLLPVLIEGSWLLVLKKLLPLPWGTQITVKFLPLITRNGDDESAIRNVEGVIHSELEKVRGSCSST